MGDFILDVDNHKVRDCLGKDLCKSATARCTVFKISRSMITLPFTDSKGRVLSVLGDSMVTSAVDCAFLLLLRV